MSIDAPLVCNPGALTIDGRTREVRSGEEVVAKLDGPRLMDPHGRPLAPGSKASVGGDGTTYRLGVFSVDEEGTIRGPEEQAQLAWKDGVARGRLVDDVLKGGSVAFSGDNSLRREAALLVLTTTVILKPPFCGVVDQAKQEPLLARLRPIVEPWIDAAARDDHAALIELAPAPMRILGVQADTTDALREALASGRLDGIPGAPHKIRYHYRIASATVSYAGDRESVAIVEVELPTGHPDWAGAPRTQFIFDLSATSPRLFGVVERPE